MNIKIVIIKCRGINKKGNSSILRRKDAENKWNKRPTLRRLEVTANEEDEHCARSRWTHTNQRYSHSRLQYETHYRLSHSESKTLVCDQNLRSGYPLIPLACMLSKKEIT